MSDDPNNEEVSHCIKDVRLDIDDLYAVIDAKQVEDDPEENQREYDPDDEYMEHMPDWD